MFFILDSFEACDFSLSDHKMAESADINSPATQSQTRIMDNQWAGKQSARIRKYLKWLMLSFNSRTEKDFHKMGQ